MSTTRKDEFGMDVPAWQTSNDDTYWSELGQMQQEAAEPGIWAGERCWRDGCAGIIEERETDEGCTCFINPPCSHCVDDRHYCPECDWQGIDEQKASKQFY